MTCPYCAEEIQPQAKKCKHCGEWLTQKPPSSQPSVDARAVAKGIKKQKQDESSAGAIGCLGLFLGLLIGFSIGDTAGLVVGGLVTFGGFIAGAAYYNRE